MKLSELEKLASGEENAKAWLELRWLQRHGWYEYIAQLEAENEMLVDALEHCGYDPDNCIDCGGPPHNEWCRFWKLRHLFSFFAEAEDDLAF